MNEVVSTNTSEGTNDLVCWSHLRWNFVFQRPQHLMVRWARTHRVFFVEEAVREHCVPSLETRIVDGVTVVVPHLDSRRGDEDGRELRRLFAMLYRGFDIRRPICWYYSPMFLPVSAELPASTVVYDCMDELSAFAGAPTELGVLEQQLFARADVVFTGGRSLFEVKRRRHRNVHCVPSSVDVAHFARAREPQPDPHDQANIPHPRIGFHGVIDERMDLDLIDELARLRPDLSLVLIGPVVKIDPARLPRRANIHYLGMKSYDELPHYLAGWDFTMLPFALNESTRYISPTKTPEYMAGGKPVVSTPIHDVVHPYGELGLVHIAADGPGFAAAIARMDVEEASVRTDAHDAFLSKMSWDGTFARIADAVERAAPPPRARAPRESARVRGYDYLIVGAGFAGAVAAERLAAVGNTVLLIDRRPHIGGNAYDAPNAHGLLVHKYGPHIFHTNSSEVFEYLSRFTAWRPYEHRVLASVDGKLLPIPINLDTVNRLYDLDMSSEELEVFFARVAEPRPEVRTSEDVIISKVGRELYEKFFRGYTRKQWALDPSELDASVIARIPVRTDRDDRYFTDRHQAMPAEGYTAMFESMLEHPNITVAVGEEYRRIAQSSVYRAMVFTGPIDEYFNYYHGRLPYRSLEFKHETLDVEFHQRAPVINHPNEHEYTRVTEFKYLTGQKSDKTSIVYEYPRAEGDPYYPIPRRDNAERYRCYQELASRQSGVHFAGRLGTYKYYNMDQVVAQALALTGRIIGVNWQQLLAMSA